MAAAADKRRARRKTSPSPEAADQAASQPKEVTAAAMKPQLVAIADLLPHPRNYRVHPPAQIEHIKRSIEEHGFYRNVVASSQGNVILAGHGVVQAARQLGYVSVPVLWLNVDPYAAAALKILTGDNELSNLAADDDRKLADLLKDIKDQGSLEGTGYDDMALANLLFVTRGRGEIADFDAAAEWVGMPEFSAGSEQRRLVVQFANAEDQQRFVDQFKINVNKATKNGVVLSAWWPARERADRTAERWE